jgi:hypothetical protein
MENNKYNTTRRILLVLRWICMRYERNKLKELEELKSVEWVKVHKENLQLRKTLEEIKKIINQKTKKFIMDTTKKEYEIS